MATPVAEMADEEFWQWATAPWGEQADVVFERFTRTAMAAAYAQAFVDAVAIIRTNHEQFERIARLTGITPEVAARLQGMSDAADILAAT